VLDLDDSLSQFLTPQVSYSFFVTNHLIFTMADTTPDPEDRMIRTLLLGGAVVGVGFFLAVALVVTLMITYNFNILEWME